MAKTLSAGKNPRIEIESIGGDLSVVGWDGDEVLLKADDEELRVRQEGDKILVSCDGDLALRAPHQASISLQMAGGDMALKNVMGGVTLREVQGDLSIRDVNSVAIESVRADFSLRGAKGEVSVRTVHGDASLREVEGSVALDSISDDLLLRDVRGNVNANVGGDVILSIAPRPDSSCSITAGDDILLVMPPDAGATLDLSADEINVAWKGVANEPDAASRVVVLGDGSASITLKAGGEIRVTSQADAAESADEFGNFAGIGFDWSGFGERISHQVDAAAKRAVKGAEAAARRAEKNLGRRAKAGVKVGRWNWDAAPGQFTPRPPKETASEEERMMILKMLAEKKITSEEADTLLSALEGDE